jgi:hypothetical protein
MLVYVNTPTKFDATTNLGPRNRSDLLLNMPPPAEQTCWQKEKRADKSEDCVQTQPDKTERERDQPNEWQQHEGKERERPAEDEQNHPADKKSERSHQNKVAPPDGRSSLKRNPQPPLLRRAAAGQESRDTVFGRRFS